MLYFLNIVFLYIFSPKSKLSEMGNRRSLFIILSVLELFYYLLVLLPIPPAVFGLIFFNSRAVLLLSLSLKQI